MNVPSPIVRKPVPVNDTSHRIDETLEDETIQAESRSGSASQIHFPHDRFQQATEDAKATSKFPAQNEKTPYKDIIASVISAAGLVSTSVLLSQCNGKPLPSWTRKFSLNATISLMSQLSSWCAIYAASHGIGQSKWSWFAGKDVRLNDIETFQKRFSWFAW
jgi:Protein of unknown function (DUF3176)